MRDATFLSATMIVVLSSCSPVSPGHVHVVCDGPECTSATAQSAFTSLVTTPGSRLSIDWLDDAGSIHRVAACAPATFAAGGVRGPHELREFGADLLREPLCSVPGEFACTGSPPPVTVEVRVGSVAAFDQSAPPTTTFAVVCDRSGSTGGSRCDLRAVADKLLEDFQATSVPAGHWFISDTRGSYGSTSMIFSAEVPPADVLQRLAAGRDAAERLRSSNLPLPEGGSSISGAIARAAHHATQLHDDRLNVIVLSDGREVGGDLDLVRHGLSERRLAALAERVGDDLPEGALTGAQVAWFGLHARGLSAPEHRALEETWRDALIRAGAASVTFHPALPPVGGH